MSHTILLLQPTANLASRTYSDYENVTQALEGIVQLFEANLKTLLRHGQRQISYEIEDLFAYIDALTDLSALVYSHDTHSYAPYNREWIKGKVYNMLKRQAN